MTLFTEKSGGAASDRTATSAATSASLPQPIYSTNTADPWMVKHGDLYYLTFTAGTEVPILCSRTKEDFRSSERVVIWKAGPDGGPFSRHVWAPELHLVGGTWYVYVAVASPQADYPDGWIHQPCVMRCRGADPMVAADWEFLGPIKNLSRTWGIDATLFSLPGGGGKDRLYCVYSGRHDANPSEKHHDLFIIELRSPEEAIPGTGACICRAELGWELTPDRDRAIAGCPTFLSLGDGSWRGIVYSGNASWLAEQSLGLLELVDASRPCDPGSWRRRARPLLVADPDRKVGPFGPGQASFLQGGDDYVWCVHHGTVGPTDGWSGRKGYVTKMPFAAFCEDAEPVCAAAGVEIKWDMKASSVGQVVGEEDGEAEDSKEAGGKN